MPATKVAACPAAEGGAGPHGEDDPRGDPLPDGEVWPVVLLGKHNRTRTLGLP
jgi:hypothetical protein